MKKLLGFPLFFGILLFACTNDKLEEPIPPTFCEANQVTYDNQVKAIIDRTCAIPGCHVQGSIAPGNFTTYDGMSGFLSDAEFKTFVIDLKDDPDLGMPPDWPTNPGPKDLTDEEFEIISCWVSQGYPEN
ncbi:MAG: hypothetical protein AAGK97_00160 [Bacteroidota bacterium]